MAPPRQSDLFVDTSGCLCALDVNDPQHRAAAQIWLNAVRQKHALASTNYVVAELVALLSLGRYGFSRPQVLARINALKADPTIHILHIDEATDAEAWKLLEARSDKDWSLVNASSFVLMKRFGMTEALTTDHHFAQAQFVRLLTP
jgi:predicted nucleic acid-binding protein